MVDERSTAGGSAEHGRHPDLEELSAYLDGLHPGEGGHGLAGHLEVCDSCAGTLGRLSLARSALRAAPPPLDRVALARARDAAVAAALEALDASGAAESSAAADARRYRLRTGERRVRLAGIAAAVLVVVGLASGLGLLAGGSGPSAGPAASPGIVPSSSVAAGAASGPASAKHAPVGEGVQGTSRPILAAVVRSGRCSALHAEGGTRVVSTSETAKPQTGCLLVRPIRTLAPPAVTFSAAHAAGRSGLVLHLRTGLRADAVRGELVIVAGSDQLGTASAVSATTLRVGDLSREGEHRLEAQLG